MPIKQLTASFPLENDSGQGFRMINEDTPIDAVKFNLKNILLTFPGENLSDPNFGVGLARALFELETSVDISGLKQRIIDQIKTYANYFSKLEVIVDVSKLNYNTLTVRLEFEFGINKLNDYLEVTVSI
jgi:hypothetical protein